MTVDTPFGSDQITHERKDEVTTAGDPFVSDLITHERQEVRHG